MGKFPHTSSIREGRESMLFSTNDIQSSIQTGTSWVHQKETRNKTAILQMYIAVLHAIKTLFLSYYRMHVIASGAMSWALQLLFFLLNFHLESASFTMLSIAYFILNHLTFSQHKWVATGQCRRRWFASSPEHLHMKHQLTYVNCNPSFPQNISCQYTFPLLLDFLHKLNSLLRSSLETVLCSYTVHESSCSTVPTPLHIFIFIIVLPFF